MTTAAQLCVHLKRHGGGEVNTQAGGLVAELCKACQKELAARTTEVDRPITPIEAYAHQQEVAMQNGCRYITNQRTQATCGLLCDEGQTDCPRHIEVRKADAKALKDKEDARHAEKLRKLAARRR